MTAESEVLFKRNKVVVVDDEIDKMEFYGIPGIFAVAVPCNPLFYKAELFSNVPTAREFLQKYHESVMGVFTDCSMSGRDSRDGFEFAKWIRESLPPMPVVMVSGNTINRPEAEQFGVHIAVVKDGDLDMISRVSSSLRYLRQYLEGRQEVLQDLKNIFSSPMDRMLMVGYVNKNDF